MIKQEKWNQFGENGLRPNCITIHNTSNYGSSARDIFNWLDNECETSQGCHYLIDAEEVIEVLPLTWKTYHSGKGRDYAFNNSIAIEICSNSNEEIYLQGQEKAVQLIKELMNTYNIPISEIYFHIDWNSTAYCPADILRIYHDKKTFIEEVLL